MNLLKVENIPSFPNNNETICSLLRTRWKKERKEYCIVGAEREGMLFGPCLSRKRRRANLVEVCVNLGDVSKHVIITVTGSGNQRNVKRVEGNRQSRY